MKRRQGGSRSRREGGSEGRKERKTQTQNTHTRKVITMVYMKFVILGKD